MRRFYKKQTGAIIGFGSTDGDFYEMEWFKAGSFFGWLAVLWPVLSVFLIIDDRLLALTLWESIV